mgnify:CR=1 FL=1
MQSFNKANGLYNPFEHNIYALINNAVERAVKRLQVCIPAIVKDANRKYVIAVPAVQQSNSDWNAIDWAEIKLPVYSPLGGGIIMSFPLAAGDTGWIIAGDLDPSLFFQDVSSPAKQAFFDRHKYQYGFFLPANLGDFTISQDDEERWVLTSLDGKTRISIGEGIDIETDKALKIKGNSVTIDSSGNNIKIDGTDWKTHTHGVGSLSVPETSPAGDPSVITGNTGGVSN